MKKVVACVFSVFLLLCGCSAQSSQLSYEDVESAGYQAIDAAKQYMNGEINQAEALNIVRGCGATVDEFMQQNEMYGDEDSPEAEKSEEIGSELFFLVLSIESDNNLDNKTEIEKYMNALDDLMQQDATSSVENTESTTSDVSDTSPESSDSGVTSQTQSQSSAPQSSQPAASQAPQQSAPQSSNSQAQASEPQSTDSSQSSGGTSTGKNNALQQAKNYIKVMPFSYEGLIHQLEFEGYSHEEAVYGADNCGANWSEQALRNAKSYLNVMPFSHSGLIEQLEFDQYTSEQATYAANNCGASWNEQAAKAAENYLKIMSFSREDLISQLEFDGYTHEQAVYGASQNGY